MGADSKLVNSTHTELHSPSIYHHPTAGKNDTSLYDYLTDEAVSTVVGAALGEDDCLRRTACEAGNYVSEVSGKEIVLMMLDRWAPTSWTNTVRAFKEAATYKDDCKKQFPCSIKP